MSEHKDYISRADELGNIHIAEEVLAAVAAAAAMEVKGVSALAAGNDFAELLGKKHLTKGIQINVEEDQVKVDLSILMSYGHIIPEVAKAVQEGVKNAIESMTGLEVAEVCVSVTGISFEKKA